VDAHALQQGGERDPAERPIHLAPVAGFGEASFTRTLSRGGPAARAVSATTRRWESEDAFSPRANAASTSGGVERMRGTCGPSNKFFDTVIAVAAPHILLFA